MFRRVAALAAFLALACPARAAEPVSYPKLLDEVWRTVDENFYDPGFHGRDWRAIGARYRARVAAVGDDAAFAKLANAMLDELKVSHLYVIPPESARTQGGVGIGAEVEEIGGVQVLAEVAPLSDAERAGLRVGDRIADPAALRGPLGAEAVLQVIGCDGKRRTVRTRHEAAGWPPPHPGITWRTIAARPGVTLGYIRIDRFDDGAAALEDAAMDELKDTQGLVIDVRKNSGGNLSALRLTSYFSGESRAAVVLLARPYLQALGRPVTAADIAKLAPTRGAYTNEAIFASIKAGNGAAVYYTEDLGPNRYGKPVVVVTSADTGSAGEGFAGQMKILAGATLVGRPTAGYLLSSDRFPLTGGWRLVVPVDGVWAPDGTDYGDRRVDPDVTVERTPADLCRADDRDLARAREVLEAKIAAGGR